jgi:hypothetical protein
LKRVALREDAPALRGIAMAQLGDFRSVIFKTEPLGARHQPGPHILLPEPEAVGGSDPAKRMPDVRHDELDTRV